MRQQQTHARATGRQWLLSLSLIVGLLAIGAAVFMPDTASLAAPGPQALGDLQWTEVHSAPGVHWNTIYFVDRNVGYAVGGRTWDDQQGNASFAKTTDGGKTWVTKTIPNSRHFMIGLACLDAKQCWVAGTNQMFRTVDGGETWTLLGNNSRYTKWLWSTGVTGQGATVLMGTTGYQADPALGYTGNFLRSTTGASPFSAVGESGMTVQWDIECPAPGVCFSASKGAVYRTTNNGANWTRIIINNPVPGGRYYGMSCTDQNTCWMSGKFPFMISTRDRGATWNGSVVHGLPELGMFWDVVMLDNQRGYATGCNTVEVLPSGESSEVCLGQGVFYRTEDGLNWFPGNAPTTADIPDLWAFSMEDVFVVDWQGKIWHGTLQPTPTPTLTATPTETPTATPTLTPTPSTGSVGGLAFHDQDGDAWRAAEEPGLPGASLALRQGADVRYTAVSDADGRFEFPLVEPGQYTLVSVAPPSGYIANAGALAFDVAANRSLSFYVGYQPAPTVTPTATWTATPTATATATATLTASPTATPTDLPTETPSATPTVTPSTTLTVTPSTTPTVTPSATPTVTPTITVSPTATATATLVSYASYVPLILR